MIWKTAKYGEKSVIVITLERHYCLKQGDMKSAQSANPPPPLTKQLHVYARKTLN